MTRKIIIDTDPGIDDAMAIFFAYKAKGIEVLGLTTTFGNVPVEKATENALTLNDVAGVSVPVAKGMAQPLVREPLPHPDFVHGKDGFGNINWPASTNQPVAESAAEFIVNTVKAHPGEVTIVALGPLGNLAKALELDPEIAGLVDEVVLMGGAHLEYGNVTPVAEANIINDPHAADIVFTANWQVTMIGLDVTHQVLLDNERLARIKQANPVEGDFLMQAAQHYINFYGETFGVKGCYFHDASTIAYVLQPELFGLELGTVRVACEGIAIGQTIVAPEGKIFPAEAWKNIPTSQICMEVDSEKLLQLFEDTLSS